MRFNPPPNWPPPPPGWQPDPTWQPDPAWGPPPPNWPLWVPDRRRTGLIIFACIALAVVAAVAVTLVVVLTGSSKSSKSEGTEFAEGIKCTADNSEEEDVCDAIRARYAAVIDGDDAGVRKYTCRAGVPYENAQALAALRAGEAQLSVTEITVKGNSARLTMKVADRSGDSKATLKFEWKKEDGTWKACSGVVN